MRNRVCEGRLDVVLLEQSVDQAGGERVASADAVEDLEPPASAALTTNPSRVLQTPLQSLTVALCASRRDVATTARFG